LDARAPARAHRRGVRAAGGARRRRPRRREGEGLMEAHAAAHGEHADHPPEAPRSSRVEPQLLGMLLFIVSEVMIFGAFFTAYFFIRIVNGDDWFPVGGHELPVYVAGVNTAILVSSSFTLHWAESCI